VTRFGWIYGGFSTWKSYWSLIHLIVTNGAWDDLFQYS